MRQTLMCKIQGPLAELFDQQQLLYDVSGAGNNWAHGHHGYGPQYKDLLLEQLRHAAEDADSLQGFLLLHSLGGGTGSGLGTYLLGMMEVRWDCRLNSLHFYAIKTIRQCNKVQQQRFALYSTCCHCIVELNKQLTISV